VPGLSDILGQEQAVKVLRRATRSGRVAQAYLFAGPQGVGKATTARALAAALNCEQEPGVGCGECLSCSKVDRGLHPDLVTLEPTGKQIKSIKIDQARALEQQLAFRPHEGRYRLVLIDGAEHLNDNAANALLKSVEEPRPRTVFVLTTAAAHRVVPTLISRCQRLRFVPLSPEVVSRILATSAPETDQQDREAAASYCEGSARRALDMLEGERISELRAVVDQITGAADTRGVGVIFDAAQEVGRDRVRICDALDLLRMRLRDGLLQLEGGGDLPGGGDTAEDPRAARERLLRQLRAVDAAQVAVRGNVNPALTLENLVLDLRGV